MRQANSWKFLGSVVVVLVLLILLAGCSQKDSAKTRVENVLNGLLKDDQSNEYQTAICQWFDGTYAMNQDDLEVALNQFEAWQAQKGIKAPIGGYTIDGVTVMEGAFPPATVVDVKIDGKPYRIKVTKSDPLEWAK